MTKIKHEELGLDISIELTDVDGSVYRKLSEMIVQEISAPELGAVTRKTVEKMCDCNQGRLPCTCKPVTQASAAPEQEAVAWLYSRPEGHVTPVVLLEKASYKDRGSWDETPLYTHPDPSEIERLRAELTTERLRADAAVGDANEAEQKLSEAMALLRERRETDGAVAYLTPDEKDWATRTDAFLSATAQPAEVKS